MVFINTQKFASEAKYEILICGYTSLSGEIKVVQKIIVPNNVKLSEDRRKSNSARMNDCWET